MSNALTQSKKPLLAGLFGTPDKRLEAERGRLEAFLSAFPGEYCGWAKDGSAAYSKGFCELLGLSGIKTLDDVQSRLSPGDAAALEGLYDRLDNDSTPFTIIVKSLDEKRSFKISGSQGRDSKQNDQYNVLWIEDITEQANAQAAFALEAAEKDRELTNVSAALSHVPRPLWLRDENQKIIWCNNTYAEFLNTTKEKVVKEQKEISAQSVKKMTAAKEKTEGEPLPGPEMAIAAIKSGKPLETDVHIVVKGSRYLLRVIETPLPGLPVTLGAAFNNTRVEELETNLKRHQSSNRELLGQLRTAIAIYSADERLEFYNAAFAQLWDLDDQYLNTQPRLGDLMEKLRGTRRLPEQADFRRFKQSWLDMFTSLIDPYDDMLHLPDGSALRMLVVPHSMGGLMMTFEDVTSRLALESSYNTLIAVQKETLDNLGEAVAVYGGNGRLQLYNPAFARLWGLHPEDLAEEPHVSVITDKMKNFFGKTEWPQQRETLIGLGLDRRMHEGRLVRKNDARGDASLVDFATVPLPDGGVMITYGDVTDTVNVENALREKNAALEAAEQLKLDFLANVSYQLRTPLNAIMGFNEILSQEYFGKLNDRQKSYTGDIKEASEKLLGLINDILDLSTLEAGQLNLERESVEVGPVLQDVFDLVTGWARKKELEITLQAPKNLGKIDADARRLQQAIINLVRNSIAFTPKGGKITLSASRKKDGLHISVSDTGIGIPEGDKARIFEPFERAHTGAGKARVDRGGAGLGLSLVKNIVTLHGGKIDLQSAPDKGTTVTMILPLKD